MTELTETAEAPEPIKAAGGPNEYTIGIYVREEDSYACVDLEHDAVLSLYLAMGKWLSRNAEQTWVCAGGPRNGDSVCGADANVEGYKFGFNLTTGSSTVKVLVPE